MNLVPSLIRTYVPLVLAYVFGWLASLGISVTDEQKAAVAGAIGTVVAGLYYYVARLLEKKYPALTWLLGSPVQPTAYQPADVTDDPPGKHEAPETPTL